MNGTHACKQDGFMFGRQTLFHVRLETTKHKGAKNLVQLGNKLIFFILVLDVKIEPFVKLFGRLKDVGHQKVEQGPEFVL